MSNDTNFNRLLAAIKYKEPDRLPLAELWVDAPIKSAFLGDVSERVLDCRKEGYNVKEDIRFWENAGYDYIRLIPRVEFFKDWLANPEIDTFDQDAANYIDEFDFSDIEKSAQFLPKGMKVIISPEGGIFEHAWMGMGYEKFMMNLVENPDVISKMCNALGETYLKLFERCVKYEYVGGFWISDDIAYTESLIISPKMIRKYLLPWYERFTSLAHENNLPFIFHSDGNLTPLIDDLIAIGIDAIHPIEPKAMDVVELKKRVQNKLALFGSVDLDFPLSRGTPSDVIKYVKKRIKEIAPGGGFAIGSSNSITTYVPLENYRAMLDTVMKYGKYPIT